MCFIKFFSQISTADFPGNVHKNKDDPCFFAGNRLKSKTSEKFPDDAVLHNKWSRVVFK